MIDDTPVAARSESSPQKSDATPPHILEIRQLSVSAGSRTILRDVSLSVAERQIFGIVGPSGAGKSTLLRAVNRLLDLQPGFRVRGSVRLRDRDVYAPDIDPDELRTRIGMLFQQPVVFPASIEANVLFGVRHHRPLRRSERQNILERSLRNAALWDEVKDRLGESALRLSVGQQQRLCLARTLAVDPVVILMDEPTSALDARSSEAIEQLMLELKHERTIVLVTHNLAQARRVTDWIACLCPQSGGGEVLESACCDAFFSSPACQKVFDHLEDPIGFT
jgi:phosphate transport system ATP-binding protein